MDRRAFVGMLGGGLLAAPLAAAAQPKAGVPRILDGRSPRGEQVPDLKWCREGGSNPHELALKGF
jgi:hypothetical protein